jgi:hypothetical protein
MDVGCLAVSSHARKIHRKTPSDIAGRSSFNLPTEISSLTIIMIANLRAAIAATDFCEQFEVTGTVCMGAEDHAVR